MRRLLAVAVFALVLANCEGEEEETDTDTDTECSASVTAFTGIQTAINTVCSSCHATDKNQAPVLDEAKASSNISTLISHNSGKYKNGKELYKKAMAIGDITHTGEEEVKKANLKESDFSAWCAP